MRESASRDRPPASHPQVNQASLWGFDPVDATITDHRGLRTPTGRTRSGRCRRRSAIMKVAAFPLAGHSGRRSLVVISIELRCQQSVRPPREGGGFGIEVRVLCFDQQLGRQCNRFFSHRVPKDTNGPAKAHPYEWIILRNSATTPSLRHAEPLDTFPDQHLPIVERTTGARGPFEPFAPKCPGWRVGPNPARSGTAPCGLRPPWTSRSRT
jgi:hypothetical protein